MHAGTDSHRPTSFTEETAWAWLTHWDEDGVVVRVADSLADAQAIRRLVRESWQARHGSSDCEGMFRGPEGVFTELVEPARRSTKIEDLSGLCLIVEALDEEGSLRIVGTLTLAIHHEARRVELVRAAVARGYQHMQVPRRVIAPVDALMHELPGYELRIRVTSLLPRASATAEGLATAPVVVYPNNFAMQPDCIEAWHTQLGRRHGQDAAAALLARSEMTGLGRYMTSLHVRLPARAVSNGTRPVLTKIQRPLFAYTCEVYGLDCAQIEAAPEAVPPRERPCTRIYDRMHTATRSIINPGPGFDVQRAQSAMRCDGVEMLVVELPCDAAHLRVSRSLEQHGAILGGVFVDARGCWRASYSLAARAGEAERVREQLRVLVRTEAVEPELATLVGRVSQA